MITFNYRKDTVMLLPVLLGIICGCAYGQRRPPNYGQGHMPETAFSCSDKIIGGYYADPETDCQMFHVCVKIPGKGVQDFRFLCPNDTSFDQENQICDDWYNIDCEASTLFYSDNFDLYRLGGGFGKVGGKVSPVNNAVGEALDDNYLQRADRGENVPQDIFRGSQSGHFFSNRNGGREDYDEDDYSKPKKKAAHDKAAKQQIKKPQDPGKEVTFHQNKDQIRFNNRNSNFRRGQVTPISTTEQVQTTTTGRPVRGQSNRQDFFRQRTQVSTTIRPTGQDNSYNPTTTTAKHAFNNFHVTTLRPFNNFGNQQPTTSRQNYQQNVAITTSRPSYPNVQQQTTPKTYQEISRTFPSSPAVYQSTSSQTQKPLNNFGNNQHQTIATQKPYNAFNNNQQQNAPTQKPYNSFNNNQQQIQTQKPFNNNQQQSGPTQKPYNTFNNNQQQVPTQKPFNSFNNNQQQSGPTQKPYNNFNNNQQQNVPTQKPYNSFNNNQQSSPTQKPYNSFNNNQQSVPTQKPYNAFNSNQQSTAKPYNAYQQASITPTHNNQPSYTTAQQNFPSTQHQNFNNQGNFNSQQNFNTPRPQNNYNTAVPTVQRNQPVQQSHQPINNFSTQKSFSKSFSESTEVTRVNSNQYQNYNNYNFGSTLDPNQFNRNFDVPKVTTSKPYDNQNLRVPNHQYPEEQDEFLKASHSQNLGSSLRAKALNVSQAAAFNYIPSGTTGKPRKVESKTTPEKNHQNFNNVPTVQAFSSQKSQFNGFSKSGISSTPGPNFRTTFNPSTFPPQPSQKKTYNPTPDRSKNQFQTSQTTTVAQPKSTSPQPFSPALPQQPNQDNQDYDYAYYDSANPSEYEGIGNVEFRRTTPHKNTT